MRLNIFPLLFGICILPNYTVFNQCVLFLSMCKSSFYVMDVDSLFVVFFLLIFKKIS